MVGLGLVGQLAVQLLIANGCRVLAIDLDPIRVKQAMDLGAAWGAAPGDDHTAWRNQATQGYGADFSMVTAASNSSAPIELAAYLCRMKGRIAIVGTAAMNLERRFFYDKELDLRMSMSYGPGRYDRRYEEVGLDYPISYVWWPKGNLTAVALMVVLCASRVNLGAGLLSAFAFSWVGLATDPLAHQVGQRLLSAEALTPIWTTLYDTPLVPWTDFNNTVVLGSFLLGLAVFYPCYRLSRPLFARYAPPLAARAQKLRVVQLLWGADLAGRLRGA